MRDKHRAADIGAVDVIAQLRLLGVLSIVVVEVVVRIQSVVTVELPSPTVKLACAALDGHGDRAARGDAVIGRIVTGQHLEFAKRILGRHDGHLATGTAVVRLSTVDHPDIVRLVEAVEADGVVGGHREWALHVGQVAADAETQCGQTDYIAAVGGQFGNLLFVDKGANHVRIGLHRQCIRTYRNGCCLRTDRQFDVDTKRARNINNNSGLLVCLESLDCDFQVVVRGVQAGNVVQSGSAADC